ncbi:hypothetical protein BU24DRAFT_466649 [Aaosphaeria arxii CBS 175.79]|uniref:P-loop containing nucleoside triphosphate hydrolase protein n=1 Tax=Aaosphaeria arxii CBS 175.79 TaxID=1450172 RepID=A0A6A5XDA9_9PLEO|nr:uncharacterized protein BU24DRAFT_466649 [Aaosphaeria arxii CBS 175.79]KAF2010891.1 hypothetical protein BU24DRAFT_466649 [Aaosphaeria arxii CBS 175.79]
MSGKPLFVTTHPRACSTAFERVFMTRRDTLKCFHEPFGDAYYYGPERIALRYEESEEERESSGYSKITYKNIFDRFAQPNLEGKRAFVKDMALYWFPLENEPARIAPSLKHYDASAGADTTQIRDTTPTSPKGQRPYPYDTKAEEGNPTIVPKGLLGSFHFAFLIRHPQYSIPSYYRCTVPPLDELTGWTYLRADEAGYSELRRLFDYLRSVGQVGPKIAGESHTNGVNGTNGTSNAVDITVVDADDLLDNPPAILKVFCESTGIEYDPSMLEWDNEVDQKNAKEAFEKWKGFHEDAINSTGLKARTHKKVLKSDEEAFAEWTEKYGEKGAKHIRDIVAANVADYEYLKQFAIKAPAS